MSDDEMSEVASAGDSRNKTLELRGDDDKSDSDEEEGDSADDSNTGHGARDARGNTLTRAGVDGALGANGASRAVVEREEKVCWVCLGTESEDRVAATASRSLSTPSSSSSSSSSRSRPLARVQTPSLQPSPQPWIQPCKCSGTTKWVHQNCILKWIDVKMRDVAASASTDICCPQCLTPYTIEHPDMGVFFLAVDLVDKLISAVSPFATVGLCCGILYVGAVSFGAATVCQLIGIDEGIDMLYNMRPSMLFTTLPLIPLALILPRLVRPSIRIRFHHTPHANQQRNNEQQQQQQQQQQPLLAPVDASQDAEDIFNQPAQSNPQRDPPARATDAIDANNGNDNGDDNGDDDGDDDDDDELQDERSLSRAIAGGIILPSMAQLLGMTVFRSCFQKTLHQRLMGGVLFLSVKGFLRVYYRNRLQFAKTHRRVLNYTK